MHATLKTAGSCRKCLAIRRKLDARNSAVVGPPVTDTGFLPDIPEVKISRKIPRSMRGRDQQVPIGRISHANIRPVDSLEGHQLPASGYIPHPDYTPPCCRKALPIGGKSDGIDTDHAGGGVQVRRKRPEFLSRRRFPES